jgi:lysophospholipase L1-like esterase
MTKDTIKDAVIALLLIIVIILGVTVIDLKTNDVKNKVPTLEVQTKKEKIVFAGDSITDRYNLNKYYQYDDKIVVNSGIGGYQTKNVIARFYNLIEQHEADKVFLLIGTNDLGFYVDRDKVVTNIEKIFEDTREVNPKAKLYYQTIYPVNRELNDNLAGRNNKDIKYINEKMKSYCETHNITYLDIYSKLVDEDDNLSRDYTLDGLHLNDAGYDVVTSILKKYVEE